MWCSARGVPLKLLVYRRCAARCMHGCPVVVVPVVVVVLCVALCQRKVVIVVHAVCADALGANVYAKESKDNLVEVFEVGNWYRMSGGYDAAAPGARARYRVKQYMCDAGARQSILCGRISSLAGHRELRKMDERRVVLGGGWVAATHTSAAVGTRWDKHGTLLPIVQCVNVHTSWAASASATYLTCCRRAVLALVAGVANGDGRFRAAIALHVDDAAPSGGQVPCAVLPATCTGANLSAGHNGGV